MIVWKALNLSLMLLLALLAMLTAFFCWPEIPVLLVLLMMPCAVYHIFNETGDNEGNYEWAVGFIWKLVLWIILIYAVIYWESGLLVDGELVEVSFLDSLYFSVSTWTTLIYGDLTPPPRLRIITSSQALLGYINMGIWISILTIWITNRVNRRKSIRDSQREYFKQFNTTEEFSKDLNENSEINYDETDVGDKMSKDTNIKD